jgi:hypothetical protein
MPGTSDQGLQGIAEVESRCCMDVWEVVFSLWQMLWISGIAVNMRALFPSKRPLTLVYITKASSSLAARAAAITGNPVPVSKYARALKQHITSTLEA